MVSLYLYLLFSLTDFNQDITLRDYEGLGLVFIIGVTIVVNMYLIFSDLIIRFKRRMVQIRRQNYLEIQKAIDL